MRENINKVSQRGERLDSLQDKTDNLAVSAQGFRRGANRVRKQMWWKDMKMRMCIIVGLIILIVIIVVPAGMCGCYLSFTHNANQGPQLLPRNITKSFHEYSHVRLEMRIVQCLGGGGGATEALIIACLRQAQKPAHSRLAFGSQSDHKSGLAKPRAPLRSWHWPLCNLMEIYL